MTADSRIKELVAIGDGAFSKRMPLMSLWQEQAENFYVERADFIVVRNIGQDFASLLSTSAPLLVRRDLGNIFSSMLRPTAKTWFHPTVARMDKVDTYGKQYLDWMEKITYSAMYDRQANFVRATKEGDHDYATFGNAVISAEMNRTHSALLYRNWHLRDVVWFENHEGKPDQIHRNWKPDSRQLMQTFGNSKLGVHQAVKDALEKDPFKQWRCRHIVIPSEEYQTNSGDGKNGRWTTPYVSIHIDLDNLHIMEEIGIYNCMYVIPRWQTIAGSQYAYSPATCAALPDARLLQSMTLTLLEAGEKAVTPPMIAKENVIRGDVELFSGGFTFLDQSYDETLGEALRPVPVDIRGIPLGMDMRKDVLVALSDAFYLNKINMPPSGGPEMTAFEVGQRVQEYIRNALPLFEPMEHEYNGALCEITFDLLSRAGGYGSPSLIPPSLRGQNIQFKFESPLHEMIDRQKEQAFMEIGAILDKATPLDPTVPNMVDIPVAVREVIEGIRAPASWLRSEQAADALTAQQQKQQRAAALMASVTQGAQAAEATGAAATSLQTLQQNSPPV